MTKLLPYKVPFTSTPKSLSYRRREFQAGILDISLPYGEMNNLDFKYLPYWNGILNGSNQSHIEKVSCSIEVDSSYLSQGVSSNLGGDTASQDTNSQSNTPPPSSNFTEIDNWIEQQRIKLMDESRAKDGSTK